MKNLLNKSVGKIGISKVSIVIHQANCIFHKTDLENDMGNDGFIEFISGEESICFCIATQIKSGKSFVHADGSTFIPTDKKHLQYWNQLNLPVAGLVYNPENDNVYWIDIKEYISKHPYIIENGPYNIPIPIENIFDNNTFNKFRDHFILYNNSMKSLESFLTAIDNIAEINNIEYQFIGVKNLFTYHRNRYATWYVLLNYFKYCKNDNLKLFLIYIVSLIPAHGDIFWHKDNIIDEKIRQKVLELLKKIWSEVEIRQLLQYIHNEEGIQRGSIGQSIYSIVDRIDNNEDSLCKIAFDINSDENSSYWAFIMYLYSFQFNHSIDASIALIDKYLDLFPSKYEILANLKQIFYEEGTFEIY